MTDSMEKIEELIDMIPDGYLKFNQLECKSELNKKKVINMINLIVARSRNNVIGNKDGIPWNIKGEQKQFRELTTGNIIIMGRKTFEDIGRPLPNRINIVISNTKEYSSRDDSTRIPTILMTVHSLKEAIDTITDMNNVNVYIAGGRKLYEEAVPIVDKMYITEVHMDVEVDDTTVFFPEFDENEFEKEVKETAGEPVSYTRTIYTRRTR